MHMLIRSTFREIKDSFGRYIAIFAIIALGVGLFAGLKVTKPAMIHSADQYVTGHNLYDFRLISTLGFTDEDIEAFSVEDGVTEAEGAVFADFISNSDIGNELVLTAHSLTDSINTLELVSGRMPEADSECVVDAERFSKDTIGTTVSVDSGNTEDTASMFKYEEYTIVGTVNSVSYMNFERGSTTVGNGSISAFMYIPYEGFDVDYYSEIFLSVESEGEIYSDEYQKCIDGLEKRVENLCRDRADIRYETLVSEAQDELDDKRAELDDGWEEFNSTKSDTLAQLDESYAEIKSGMEEIESAEVELSGREQQLSDSQAQLDSASKQISSSRAQFEREKSAAVLQYNNTKTDLNNGIAACDAELKAIEGQGMTDRENELIAQKSALQYSLMQLEAQYTQAMIVFDGSESEIENAEIDIYIGQAEIDDGYIQIASAWQELNSKKQELQEGYDEYQSALQEANSQFADAEQELNDGEAEIADAQKKIDDIKAADIYVLDRTKNVGYAYLENDSKIVEGMSNVFPMFFLLIAALVCITTMTRMVDEQRTNIGVLRALGYSGGAIMGKYLFYSGSASFLGCVAGFFAGSYLFPSTIWKAYSIMYSIGDIDYYFDPQMLVLSTVIYLACAMAATWSTCRKELSDVPAELIRPSTPKSGKRVLLEYITILWKHFSFLKKVSVRNIFRYKKRLFMMVLGVGGCTALLITGFGINDSIKNVVNYQFDEIMQYDAVADFENPLTDETERAFTEASSEYISDVLFLYESTQDVSANGVEKSVNFIATDSKDISGFIDMHNGGKSIDVPGMGEAVLSKKLAKELDVKIGDSITVRNGDMQEMSVTVSGIFDNYVYHYVIISQDTYVNQWNKLPEYKTAYLNIREGENVHETATKIASIEGTTSVTLNADMRERIDTSMSSLNYIIILVIICAGALAFIVIYNLTNININERIREIATIKVLGFYANESAAYVFRENMAMTVMGGIIGLPLGKLLHIFVMNQINIDIMAFDIRVSFWSYLISFVLTVVFAGIVDFFMYFKLEKIDMAESLKSIE